MNVLVVGLGSMGKRRARLLQSLGHAVLGVDSVSTRRTEAAALGIAPYESIDAALALGGIGAGLVCTAPLSHAAVAGALLNAGLPVFTELNLVADGYEELQATAAAKGLPLFLSSTMLYRAEVQYIAKKYTVFAKPVNYIYHIGQYLPDWHPWENYKDFFVGNARTGGVREIFGIDLPWLWDTFGPALPVCVQADTLSALALPYPDSWFVTLRHADGTKGILAADVVSPKAVRNFELFGDGLHLFWEGSPTSLYEYDTASKEKKRVAVYQSYEHDPRYSDNVVENAYLDELVNFFEVVAGTGAPRWSYTRDAEVIALMDAIEAMGAVPGAAAPTGTQGVTHE